MRATLAFVLVLLAGWTATPTAAAEGLQQAHVTLKADARALEDRARAAGEAVAAGRDPPLSGLARDVADLAARTRRLAREAAPGSYLRQHLSDTAADLARLAGRLETASAPGEAERILEETVTTLFWGFRG